MTCDCAECRDGVVKHLGGYRLFALSQMKAAKAPNGATRVICPDCVKRPQAECGECDCKALYWSGEIRWDGYKSCGQCQCCSEAHE